MADSNNWPLGGDGTGKANTSAVAIVSMLILISVGLVFVFAGKKIIKVLLVLLGFFFFACITIVIAGKIVDLSTITKGQRIGILVSSLIIGILGGLLSWCLYKLGIFILGFIMGYNLGGLILQFAKIESQWGRIGIMIACGLVIGILAICLMKFMIVIATAFVGSQAVMIGIDVVANKGYINSVNVMATFKKTEMNAALWAMLGSSIALMLIGIIVQFKAFRDNDKYVVVKEERHVHTS
ncbi:hypothetical protein CONCODRAFT_7090 [Conidiobolus coronatus NRRL 28638]|uniref:Transmembrane protein 198 n=1 Tax=Conidiobolus coronatus (strain ATCC 28846 / CBS 209.66 / NRRL 28638) TaxID=796925 RepID=A0A137P5X4_CONC2|nr:hypothetical protein CONCODRAFT_7090 [Conidiobolus coronatus NRRL 28638]|eukprot:KXN70334.1 hypothetical protein CONCODRAFT_7090 [Conidiobolus coronatus NRRL 28638]